MKNDRQFEMLNILIVTVQCPACNKLASHDVETNNEDRICEFCGYEESC